MYMDNKESKLVQASMLVRKDWGVGSELWLFESRPRREGRHGGVQHDAFLHEG